MALKYLLDLNTKVSSARRDMVCSLGLKNLIPTNEVPPERWSDPEFLAIILCLKLQNPTILENVSKILMTSSDLNMIATAAWFFAELKTKDSRVQVRIAQLLHHGDLSIQLSAALVLAILKPTDPQVQQQMIEAILRLNDENIVLPLLKLLQEIPLTPALKKILLSRIEQAPLKKLIREYMP